MSVCPFDFKVFAWLISQLVAVRPTTWRRKVRWDKNPVRRKVGESLAIIMIFGNEGFHWNYIYFRPRQRMNPLQRVQDVRKTSGSIPWVHPEVHTSDTSKKNVHYVHEGVASIMPVMWAMRSTQTGIQKDMSYYSFIACLANTGVDIKPVFFTRVLMDFGHVSMAFASVCLDHLLPQDINGCLSDVRGLSFLAVLEIAVTIHAAPLEWVDSSLCLTSPCYAQQVQPTASGGPLIGSHYNRRCS